MENLIREYGFAEPIYVTRPLIPSLDDYHELLRRVWDSRWLTNNGQLCRELERRLAQRLDVANVSLFCNGTTALLVALRSLDIEGGEVITTPFTFPSTVHALHWNGIRPVFCDIDRHTYSLDPNCIEALIGPQTRAILGVHVYGFPCDVEAIQAVASRHGLRVIYDAAPGFGVRYRGRDLASYGDVSMLSFHATKIFTTAEGGALVAANGELKRRIDLLRNFGIAREDVVVGPGINGKMNELEAAYGLLALDLVDREIEGRRQRTALYRRLLSAVPGITCPADMADTQHNYAYFPILVSAAEFGMSRDELCATLRRFKIFARKYYYPLCSDFPCYAALKPTDPGRLRVAEDVAQRVLCLPLFAALSEDAVRTISAILIELHERSIR
jgi:dTDP-4-amino-4,6-dideoxygalactose transaminase